MRVVLSLAESLMNAISGGRVRGVQFRRSWAKETETFEDLNAVIGSSLDAEREVVRENSYRRLREEFEAQYSRAELQAARKVVEAARRADNEGYPVDFSNEDEGPCEDCNHCDCVAWRLFRAALAEYDSIAKGGEGK